MPQISRFYGIVITMYYADHRPPHFHAAYAGANVSLTIETLAVQAGSLPPRQMMLIREWATLHRDELRLNWDRARAREPLTPIAPLA